MKKFVRMLVAAVAVHQIVLRLFRKKLHLPIPTLFGFFLDSRYRRKLQPPDVVIERSGIKPGMKVLELGCGSGGYTTHVARAVGPGGSVTGVDIQAALLRHVRRKLRTEQRDLGNISLVESDMSKLPFADHTFDLAYMITVLQEIPNPVKVLKEAARVVNPGGIIAITEFLPDPDYCLQSTTIQYGKQAGLIVDGVAGTFWHYTVRFKKV